MKLCESNPTNTMVLVFFRLKKMSVAVSILEAFVERSLRSESCVISAWARKEGRKEAAHQRVREEE